MSNVVKKVEYTTQNPDDPNVRDPEHAHELGGALGMTVGGVAGGIAAGVAAGAAMGSVAGPIGAIAGAAIGGALGGAAGESIAANVNPTVEEKYWETTYVDRPYVQQGRNFDHYRPAYRHGIDAYSKYAGKSFETVEPELRSSWETTYPEKDALDWSDARDPARDAYNRVRENYFKNKKA
ncbi:MAG: hypothetical protein ACKVOE_02190 [Rickettsiales bacterium]